MGRCVNCGRRGFGKFCAVCGSELRDDGKAFKLYRILRLANIVLAATYAVLLFAIFATSFAITKWANITLYLGSFYDIGILVPDLYSIGNLFILSGAVNAFMVAALTGIIFCFKDDGKISCVTENILNVYSTTICLYFFICGVVSCSLVKTSNGIVGEADSGVGLILLSALSFVLFCANVFIIVARSILHVNCDKQSSLKQNVRLILKCKMFMSIVCGTIAMAAVATVSVIIFGENNLRKEKARAAELGISRAHVEQIFGVPYYNDETTWFYYDEKAQKLFDAVSENYAALNSCSDSVYARRLVLKSAQLQTALLRTEFKCLEITFDEADETVSCIVLNTRKHFGKSQEYKRVENEHCEPLNFGYFVNDKHGGQRGLTIYKQTAGEYCADYYDGSYFKAYADVRHAELTYENCVRFSWENYPFVKYEKEVIKVGEVDSNGVWVTTADTASCLNLPLCATEINASSFDACHDTLQSLMLPETVNKIETLRNCVSLEEIAICDKQAAVGRDAFKGRYIKKASVSADILKIMSETKECCETLTDLKIIGGTIETRALENFVELRRVEISGKTEKINSHALYNCAKLEALTLSNSAIIEHNAFADCESLRSVVIGDETEIIPDSAFWGCVGLENAKLGSGVKSIGNYAFCGCVSLQSLVLRNGLREIGWNAFKDCKSLKNAVFDGSVAQWPEINSADVGAEFAVLCKDGVIYGKQKAVRNGV